MIFRIKEETANALLSAMKQLDVINGDDPYSKEWQELISSLKKRNRMKRK